MILFAPGAGTRSSHPVMVRWAGLLGTLPDGPCQTFDYPYALAGRGRPDAHDVLVSAHAEALDRVRTPDRVILAGRSMGGRIGCHVSLVRPVDALVAFSYPLLAMSGGSKGRAGAAPKEAPARAAVLRALATPILFISGDRDPLAPLPALEAVRAQMSAPTRLVVVRGGDHSLSVRVRELAGRTAEGIERALLAQVAEFLAHTVTGRLDSSGSDALPRVV